MIISFSEILVILVVGIFLVRPEDIPTIGKKIAMYYKYFLSFKSEILKNFNLDSFAEDDENYDQINYYLNQIIQMDGKYDGEYSLKAIKNRYQLLKAKFKSKKLK